MASRYMLPYMRSSSSLDRAEIMSTTPSTRSSVPLGFSSIYVSIDTNEIHEYHHNSHNHNQLGQSQSSRRPLGQIPAVHHENTARPKALQRVPVRIFDHSTGRYVRSTGPARPTPASDVRQPWESHVELIHSVDSLISRAPRSWYDVGHYLCWPGPAFHPPFLDSTTLENSRLAPRRPQGPASRLRPVRNSSSLVSLAEIAIRFGIEPDAIQTLNASAEKLRALRFIVLYEGGNHNSGCYGHLVVSAKVNLHLLPGYELPYPDQDVQMSEHEHSDFSNVLDCDFIDLRRRTVSPASRAGMIPCSSIDLSPPSLAQYGTPSSAKDATEASNLPPITVFSQYWFSHQPDAFKFLGDFEIEETEFFAPKSPALVRMLEQKSGGRASKADLEREWAKIKLVRHEINGNL
ncbi:hypothetical protein QM012_007768 [Aureobasidium pullulans]|uniref:Uncharacterized protein n=1 Tax=Aureobasidium pullulans TaxID=5580 RepID=A0ABR0TL62_AURPU